MNKEKLALVIECHLNKIACDYLGSKRSIDRDAEEVIEKMVEVIELLGSIARDQLVTQESNPDLYERLMQYDHLTKLGYDEMDKLDYPT